MKYIFLVCIFYITDLKAQNTYSIDYTQFGQSNILINGQYKEYELKSRLIYNDTMSFYYYVTGKNDEHRNATVLGDKLIHHGLMYNRNNDELLHEVAWPKKKYFVIVDSSRPYKWIFNKERKNILGYNCNLAYSVSQTNDTTLVWYTNELGNLFGPSFYFGLPGIVLEAFTQQYGRHYLATKIEKSSTILVQPNVKKIPINEYLEHKKNL